MKTAEKDPKGAQADGLQVNKIAKTENRPSIPGKDKNNANLTAGQADGQNEAGPSANQDTTAHPGRQPDRAQPAGTGQVAQKQEPAGGIAALKPAYNLEQTLKTVDGLHRLSIQRLALIARIKTLEDFEVKLAEEHDELESNPYQGCKLIIEDDKRRQFVTNTPNLIRMVSQFIFDACLNKLAEIEAGIVFPRA